MSGTTRRRLRPVRRQKKHSAEQILLPGMAHFMRNVSTKNVYERLLERDSTCLEAIQWLTRNHLIAAGNQYQNAEAREEQLKHARRLLRRWPDSRRDSLYYVMCRTVLTILEAHLAQPDEAQLFERVIQQFKPDNDWTGTTNADFLFRIGAAYYHRGRVHERATSGSGIPDLQAAFTLVNFAVRVFPSHRGYRRHLQTIAGLLQTTHVLDMPVE